MITIPPRSLSLVALLAAACGPAPRATTDATGPEADADVCAALVCPQGEACCAGTCSSDPSCGLTLTSLSTYDDFVGGGDYVTLRGTGFGPGLHVFIGDGRAPVHVRSSTEAVIVTPPAVTGRYDVRVELGGLTASLPDAFGYHAYGFTQQWVTVAMSTSRGNYPAMTTLQDGRVLIVGGSSGGDDQHALATAELYDPVIHATISTAGPMTVPRYTAAAITLLDGRSLIVGVCNSPSDASCLQHANRGAAELFDPVTGTFTLLASRMVDQTRVYPTPVLLPDGRVLIASRQDPTAELFDPETNTFSLLPSRSSFASLGRPARLRDGRVAFLSPDGVEVFDPDTGALVVLSTHGIANGSAAVYTLPDGRLISPGGMSDDGSNFVPSHDVAIFDPSNGTTSVMSQTLTSPRMKFGSALLRDGTVMVAAGVDASYPKSWWCTGFDFPTTSAVDLIDPVTGSVAAFAPLPETNMELIATTLLDGSILVGGGAPCGGAGAYPYLYYLQSAPIQ